jgi:hypothetical protein
MSFFETFFSGTIFPSVEERVWVPPNPDSAVNDVDDENAMDTSDDATKFKNRLSDEDLDKFLIVSRCQSYKTSFLPTR